MSIEWIKDMFIKLKDEAGAIVGIGNMHDYNFGKMSFNFIDMDFGVVGVSFWEGDDVFNFDVCADYEELINELNSILG